MEAERRVPGLGWVKLLAVVSTVLALALAGLMAWMMLEPEQFFPGAYAKAENPCADDFGGGYGRGSNGGGSYGGGPIRGNDVACSSEVEDLESRISDLESTVGDVESDVSSLCIFTDDSPC